MSYAYLLDEFISFLIEQFSGVWLFFILYFSSVLWRHVWKRRVLAFGRNWMVEAFKSGFDVSWH